MKTAFLFALLSASVMSITTSCERKEPHMFCASTSTIEPLHFDNTNRGGEITCSGVIQQQGITTYQYGTHTIGCCGTYYALRSQTINLDDYVGQTVTITGAFIEGYPVENGPEYVEVTDID